MALNVWKIQRILRRFQINHKESVMKVFHVEAGLVVQVGHESHGDTNEKHTLFLVLFVPKPLKHKYVLVEFSCSEGFGDLGF